MLRYRIGRFFLGIRDWFVAQFAILLLKILRLFPPDKSADFVAAAARKVGPFIPRNRVGLANLRLAFPEKSEQEIRNIARESWAQLARTTFEYVHLDRIFDFDPDNPDTGRIEVRNAEQFMKLRDDGAPAIIFTGHLANWELLPISAARFDLEVLSLYRAPNNKLIASRLAKTRNQVMDNLVPSGPGAAFRLSAALERNAHVGLLVDQKFRRGIQVPFFGHPVWTNPLLAKLARSHDCPVHGARVVRLPGGRFRLEITDEIRLPRDEKGLVDVEEATAMVTGIIEEWVREYPEQWLWFHKRWDK